MSAPQTAPRNPGPASPYKGSLRSLVWLHTEHDLDYPVSADATLRSYGNTAAGTGTADRHRRETAGLRRLWHDIQATR